MRSIVSWSLAAFLLSVPSLHSFGSDCSQLPAGPFEPKVFAEDLGFTEDLTFDGMGSLVTWKDGYLAKINGEGVVSESRLSKRLRFAAGTRYAANGNLVVANPLGGKVHQVKPDGTVQTWLKRVSFPNAIFGSTDGRIFVSASFSDSIYEYSNGEVRLLAQGGLVERPNGLFFDTNRRQLFFNSGFGQGQLTIGRIDFDQNNNTAAPVSLITLDNAGGDGMTMDSCGNLYIVDNNDDDGTREIRRFTLDPAGNIIDQAVIARFEESITNLQFARGPGFNEKTLFVSGFGGTIYSVEIGVTGAAVAQPSPNSLGKDVDEINVKRL